MSHLLNEIKLLQHKIQIAEDPSSMTMPSIVPYTHFVFPKQGIGGYMSYMVYGEQDEGEVRGHFFDQSIHCTLEGILQLEDDVYRFIKPWTGDTLYSNSGGGALYSDSNLTDAVALPHAVHVSAGEDDDVVVKVGFESKIKGQGTSLASSIKAAVSSKAFHETMEPDLLMRVLSTPPSHLKDWELREDFEKYLGAYIKKQVEDLTVVQHTVDCSEKTVRKVESALVKSIRRGWSALAVKYASALYNGSFNKKLWDALAVFAMEDIGPANPTLVAQVLYLVNNPNFRMGLNPHALIKYIVQEMALSPKTRILADLAIYCDARGGPKQKNMWMNKTESDLIGWIGIRFSVPENMKGMDNPDSHLVMSALQSHYYATLRLMGDRECESVHGFISPITSISTGREQLRYFLMERYDVLTAYIMSLCTLMCQKLAAGWLVALRILEAQECYETGPSNSNAIPEMISGVPPIAYDASTMAGRLVIKLWSQNFSIVGPHGVYTDEDCREFIATVLLEDIESNVAFRTLENEYTCRMKYAAALAECQNYRPGTTLEEYETLHDIAIGSTSQNLLRALRIQHCQGQV